MLLSSSPSIRLSKPASLRRTPAVTRRSAPFSVRLSRCDVSPALASKGANHRVLVEQSSTPLLGRVPGFRRDPELGLCSVLFVISMALGSFFTLAVISIPALNAFRRLAISTDKLAKVASEEVPGTLSSLKLSSMEINDLTSQLNNLRQRILGNQYGEKVRRKRPSSHGGKRKTQ